MLWLWPDWKSLTVDFTMPIPIPVLLIIVALALLIFLTKDSPPER
jgi:hypothetical protein